MIRNLVSKKEIFFDLFDKICTGISEGAHLLVKMVDSRQGFGDYAQKMKTIEHQTDQVVHNLMSLLHKTFVTPIDREEIHKLAVQLDDIIDQIEAAASRMDLYCCDCLPPEVPQLAEVILESVNLVQEMVGLLRRLKKPGRILELTVKINQLEDQADNIRRSTVARLFREEKNYLELIKWKDILEYMERATDCCEDVANITEGIVIENT